MTKRVAIVGTGIAGMSCAADLHPKFELRIFEKNDYVGGHTHTVEVDEEGVRIPIDTGFMVYNETTYPKLTELFAKLQIETTSTIMSFSVQHLLQGLEFAGTGWNGLFSQRRNLVSLKHWRLLKEIHRFNQTCGEVLIDEDFESTNVEDYCRIREFSSDFRDSYLIPMSAAVWSSSQEKMLQFPITTLVRFFTNHRFLSLHGQLVWRTVVGGSHRYRDALVKPFKERISTKSAVKRIRSEPHGVTVFGDSFEEKFDAVVLACHANEALQLLENPSSLQDRLLSCWQYKRNIAILHGDERVMPRSKRAWTSWNYRLDHRGASTIYWMNRLQRVSEKKNYFISINDTGVVDPRKIYLELDYHHPQYDLAAVRTQKDLPKLNQEGRVFFCGSYFRYGFHEDALVSGLDAAVAVKGALG